MSSVLATDAIIADLRQHAARETPRECCGLVTVERGRQRYRACRNVASGDAEFEIDPADWAETEDAGEILAVCHSHPFSSPEPSQADRVGCEQTGLPWLIVNHPVGHWVEIRPNGYRAPLVGRQFSWGVLDCYSLVRDFYAQTLGIALADGERPGRAWLGVPATFYRDRLIERGFVEVKTAQRYDVLLLRCGAPSPNHCAVLVDDNVIMHHFDGRLSSRDVYGGWYRLNTAHVMRHRDVK